jgi:8-oxo-dGTP pyrophosphatase MutT (NUDIX family)
MRGSGVEHSAAGTVLIFRRKRDPDLVTIRVLVSQRPAERGGDEVVLATVGVLVATPAGSGATASRRMRSRSE